MGLRNGILIRIRKKHIRIGNKFDYVEGVMIRSKEKEKKIPQQNSAHLLANAHELKVTPFTTTINTA